MDGRTRWQDGDTREEVRGGHPQPGTWAACPGSEAGWVTWAFPGGATGGCAGTLLPESPCAGTAPRGGGCGAPARPYTHPGGARGEGAVRTHTHKRTHRFFSRLHVPPQGGEAAASAPPVPGGSGRSFGFVTASRAGGTGSPLPARPGSAAPPREWMRRAVSACPPLGSVCGAAARRSAGRWEQSRPAPRAAAASRQTSRQLPVRRPARSRGASRESQPRSYISPREVRRISSAGGSSCSESCSVLGVVSSFS